MFESSGVLTPLGLSDMFGSNVKAILQAIPVSLRTNSAYAADSGNKRRVGPGTGLLQAVPGSHISKAGEMAIACLINKDLSR